VAAGGGEEDGQQQVDVIANRSKDDNVDIITLLTATVM
jgi:hypothetical protein